MRKTIVSKAPVWKAVTFAAVLGLAMVPYPSHAAPASGGDTVQSLYDALLIARVGGGERIPGSIQHVKDQPPLRSRRVERLG